MNKKLLIFFILVLFAAQSCGAPTNQPSATESPATQEPITPTEAPIMDQKLLAKLSELAGLVEVKNVDQAAFSTADTAFTLGVNGQVRTGSDGRARLDLSSGTIVRVAPSTLFTLVSNEEVEGGLATQIKLEIGNIFIILNGGSAQVETPSGVAAVQGSYLKIEIDPITGDIKLTCLEGNCSASNPAGSVEFTNGQSVILRPSIDGSWLPPELGEMTIEEFNEWLENNPEAQKLVDEGLAKVNKCSEIVAPATDSSFTTGVGKTKFEWTETPGASSYKVTFINANGAPIEFITDGSETNLEKYLEGVFPDPGNVSWKVTPLDESGQEICTSQQASFSKPDSILKSPIVEEEQEKIEEVIPSCDICDQQCPNWNPQSPLCSY